MSLFYYAIHFAAAAGHIPERSNGAPAPTRQPLLSSLSSLRALRFPAGAYSLRELRAAARALCAENGPRVWRAGGGAVSSVSSQLGV